MIYFIIDEAELDQVIPAQSREIDTCSEVYSENPIVIEIVSDESQSLIEMETHNLNQFETDNEMNDTPIIFQNVSIGETENISIGDTNSNKICDKNDLECDRKIIFNNKSSVENTLKNILVWPEAKIAKNKKQKERLPSVLTSDMWINIMKAKEEEKQVQLQKKEEIKKIKLEKREVVKKQKLEAKRIKQEKIEAANQIKLIATKIKQEKKGCKEIKRKKAQS